MTRQNRLKCRDQLEAAECSKKTRTLIKEQARLIHREVVDEAKVQAGAKAEAESKNSPESKTISKTYKTGQDKSRVKIQAKGQ